MSLNVVHLVGRAGGDPQMKYFDSGNRLCELTLAVNRLRRDDPPDWFNLKIWGKTADVAENWVRKGKQISIQGTLTIETWQDRNTGAQRSKPVVIVDRLELLGSKRDSNPDMNNYGGGYGGGGEF